MVMSGLGSMGRHSTYTVHLVDKEEMMTEEKLSTAICDGGPPCPWRKQRHGYGWCYLTKDGVCPLPEQGQAHRMKTHSQQELVERIRKLLEVETAECPACGGKGHIFSARSNDPRYDDRCRCGTGRVPRYPELLEVVREKCEHPYSAWHDTAGFQAFCPDCGIEWEPTPENLHTPTGYITRNWEDALPGGLRGPIEDAVEGTDLEDAYYNAYYEELLEKGSSLPTDKPAATALLKVLEAQAKGVKP